MLEQIGRRELHGRRDGQEAVGNELQTGKRGVARGWWTAGHDPSKFQLREAR